MRVEIKDNFGRLHSIDPKFVADIFESDAIKDGCIVQLSTGKEIIVKLPISEASKLLK